MDLALDLSDHQSDDLSTQVRGDIIVPETSSNDNESSNADFKTLDEPIIDTISRDLKAIGRKVAGALVPSANNVIMKEWDLWGPLIMCTYIGLILQEIGGDSSGSQFTELFALFWIGTGIITYNFVFCTSSKISLFQCICVLGYCLGPLAISVTIFESMHLLNVSSGTVFLRFIISTAGAVWASLAAIRILSNTTIPVENKYMALGPVIIFYALISLLILYHSA